MNRCFILLFTFTILLTGSTLAGFVYADESVQVRIKVNVYSGVNATNVTDEKIKSMIDETNLILKQCQNNDKSKTLIQLTYDKTKDLQRNVQVKDPLSLTGANVTGPFNSTAIAKITLQGLKEIKFDWANKTSNGYKLFITPDFEGDKSNALGVTSQGSPVSTIEHSDRGLEGYVLAHEFVHGKGQDHNNSTGNLMNEAKPRPSPTTDQLKNLQLGKLTKEQCDELFKSALREGPKDKTPSQKTIQERQSYNSPQQSFFRNISNDELLDAELPRHNIAFVETFGSIPLNQIDFDISLWKEIPKDKIVDLHYKILVDSDSSPETGVSVGQQDGVDYIVNILASGIFPFSIENETNFINAVLIDTLTEEPLELEPPKFRTNIMWPILDNDNTENESNGTPAWDSFSVTVPTSNLNFNNSMNAEYVSLDEFGNIQDSLITKNISFSPVIFPELKIEPDLIGNAGDTITVKGRNFSPNSEIRILFDHTEIEKSTTNALGEFTASTTVPNKSAGDYYVDVFDNSDLPGLVVFEIKETSPPGGGCLIATAAYDTELAPQVQFLREIRDNTVLSTSSGTAFMSGFNQLYYSFSPTVADWERENPLFQEVVRAFITPMISSLSIMTLADQGSEASVLGLGMIVIGLNIGLYVVLPAMAGFKITRCMKPRN